LDPVGLGDGDAHGPSEVEDAKPLATDPAVERARVQSEQGRGLLTREWTRRPFVLNADRHEMRRQSRRSPRR
jgi:hypothetical protein